MSAKAMALYFRDLHRVAEPRTSARRHGIRPVHSRARPLLIPLWLFLMALPAMPSMAMEENPSTIARNAPALAVLPPGTGHVHERLVIGMPWTTARVPAAAAGTDPADAAGRVRVVSTVDGRVLWSVDGQEVNERLGESVVALGDVDGDGEPDLAVAAPLATRPATATATKVNPGTPAELAGRILVLSGRDGTVLRQIWGDAYAQLGTSMARLGDCDGDGVLDLVAGAPVATVDEMHLAGEAWCISSRTGRVLFKVRGARKQGGLGEAVCGLTDLNGDGFMDFGVAARGSPYDGEVTLHSGKDGSLIGRIAAPEKCKWFGRSLRPFSGAVDRMLLAASAPEAKRDDWRGAGSVFIYSIPSGVPVIDVGGARTGQAFGFSLERVGDLDGDGTEELCVGSPGASATPDGGREEGAVQILSSGTGKTLWRLPGSVPGGRMGCAIAALGYSTSHPARELVLASGRSQQLLVVDARNGKPMRQLEKHLK